MWEYSITFEDEKSSEFFKKELNKIIKKHNGIITGLYSLNCYKILIAVPIIERFKIHNIIKEKIAESILLFFKKKFILSGLDFEINKTIEMSVFIKSLIVFDSDIDKEIIIERLKFDNNLIVNSFLNFKLGFLKHKWKELISLANDNAMYLLSRDSFLELIKFLISNLENRQYVVNIFSKENCYLLCDVEGNSIKDFLLEKNIIYDDSSLLTSLVALNPQKIIIHCNSFIKDRLLKNLYEFFSNRIEIKK